MLYNDVIHISKADYLRFRKLWKKNYMKISRQIRVLKKAEKDFRYKSPYLNDLDANSLQGLKAHMSTVAHLNMLAVECMKQCARFSVEEDRKNKPSC